MSDVTTDGTTWIQKRSSVFNNTNNTKSAKSVDKELARLKNIGAVSSVWTNKFVQEDSSGGCRQSFPRATSALSGSKSLEDENESVQAQQQQQQQEQQQSHDACQALLDKAQQDIVLYKTQALEETERCKQLQEASKEEAASLWFQCETLKTQFAQTEARLKKAQVEIESYKQQLVEQKGVHQVTLDQQHQSSHQEAASLWFQYETLKTDFAHMEARLKRAHAEIEDYKLQLAEQQKSLTEAAKDEAASLWFQCETLKTEFAHTEARLKTATIEIESYKQQLEQEKHIYQKAMDERAPEETDALRLQCETLQTDYAQLEARFKTAQEEIKTYKQQHEVNDEAAALWFQCEKLKTEFAQTEARLKKANAEIETYKDQLKASQVEEGVSRSTDATLTDTESRLEAAYAEIQVYKQQLEEQKTAHARALADNVQHVEEAGKEEAASLWFQNETLKTEFAQLEARFKKTNADIQVYRTQLEEQKVAHELAMEQAQEASKDEAASLWFQCETLKTQFAQTEARLKKARVEIDNCKQQERAASEENDACVRRLAQLVVKQDALIEEYNESHINQEDVALLNDQVAKLKSEKEAMQQTILTLKADLEMNQRQMDLVLAVSTEIQNEFTVYKEEREQHVQRLLEKKELECSKRLPEDLHAEIAKLKETLATRDKTIEDLTSQLKTQLESSDTHVMELTKTILDKDAYIMDMRKETQEPETHKPRVQVRNFAYSDDDDDDDDSDVLMLSYSDGEHFHDENLHEFTDAVSSPISSTTSFDSTEDVKHFSYASAKSTTESEFIKDINQRLSGATARFDGLKENWPIPPPTPPPSDPLPPLPNKEPVVRRTRSLTMGIDDAPDTSIYRTSIHQTNELPKIIPLQKQPTE